MKTTVIALCLVFASLASAQDHQNIHGVVGDTTYIIVGNLGSYPAECQEECTVDTWSSSDSSVLFSDGHRMVFVPPHNGTWTGSGYYSYAPTAATTNEGCRYEAYSINITAYGVGDSTIKLRPQYMYLDMYEASAGAPWETTAQITVDNNVASPTVFKNFRLAGDLPPGLQVQVLANNTPVTEYNAAALERHKSLTLRFTLPGATIANNLFFQGALLVDAQSADTLQTLQSQLNINVYQFLSVSATSPESALSLTVTPNPASKRSSISFVSQTDGFCSYSVTDLAGKTLLSSASLPCHAGKSILPLSIEHIPAGEYFVTLSAGTGSATTKFVVLK